jgi:ribosomal protein S18 acetylase RimI-like enzyme
MNDLVIQSARLEDVARVSELLSQVQRRHYMQYPNRFRNPDDVDLRALVRQYLEDEKRRVLVACRSGVVVGYLLLELEEAKSQSLNQVPAALSVEQIAVDEAFHGQGIGTALLAAAEAHARRVGIRVLELDVWSFNEKAERSFSKSGFFCYNKRMWKVLD